MRNDDGASSKAPVPGGNIRSTDQKPFETIEFVSNTKVAGFHKDTVVPSGVMDATMTSLSVLLAEGLDWSGLLIRFCPALNA